MAVSFIGGGNQCTCRKPLTNFITQGEGPIREIQWMGDFIAWANDMVNKK
jgi:hypothetical protein